MRSRPGCLWFVFETALVVGIGVWILKKISISTGPEDTKALMIVMALLAVSIILALAIGLPLAKYGKRKEEMQNAVKTGMGSVDQMTGVQFERWCGSLLKCYGFRNIRYTATTGDHGVDIVAERDGERYAVQCKRFVGSVGNGAVQEVQAGKAMYDCDCGIVMTNSYFTPGAISLAEANDIELWDRDTLSDMHRRIWEENEKKKRKKRNRQVVVENERDEWDELFDVISITEDDY